ncbi:MAG: MvdC/MvdD family ATP grasp protein [Pseudonocardiaceae bacterium]
MATSRTVLVLTGPEDPTADAVISEITRRGIRVARHDLGDFPARASLSAIHDSDGWSGRITGTDATTNLDEVVAVYYRRPSRFTFPPGMSDVDRAYAEAEARLGVGGVLTALGGSITPTTSHGRSGNHCSWKSPARQGWPPRSH